MTCTWTTSPAAWVGAIGYDCLKAELAVRFGGRVFAAHEGMLAEFLGSAS